MNIIKISHDLLTLKKRRKLPVVAEQGWWRRNRKPDQTAVPEPHRIWLPPLHGGGWPECWTRALTHC